MGWWGSFKDGEESKAYSAYDDGEEIVQNLCLNDAEGEEKRMNYFVAVDSFCGHRLGSEVKFDVAEHIDDYEEKQ